MSTTKNVWHDLRFPVISLLLLTNPFRTLLAQDKQSGVDMHASLQRGTGHVLTLAATGAWPSVQIANRLRREYGWILDIEESPQTQSSSVTQDPDGKLRPLSRTKVVAVPDAHEGVAVEQALTLNALASELSSTGEHYRVVKNGSNQRFDLIPDMNSSEPLLNTVISVPQGTRTVADTIDIILAALSAATKQQIIQGGIVDSSLFGSQATLGGVEQARTLLSQALDSLPFAKVWILTYDPQDKYYAIGFETAIKSEQTQSGQVLITPVRQSQKAAK